MGSDERKLSVEPVEAAEPLVGRWLAYLEEGRERTKRAVAGLSQAELDWQDERQPNSVGTLLYHIAAIEMDWLFVEILEQPFLDAVVDLFPADVRDETGRLGVVTGEELAAHLHRLDATRRLLLEALKPMTLAEFQRPRTLPNYDVTPEWVLLHLLQHEAAHRGQIEGRARFKETA